MLAARAFREERAKRFPVQFAPYSCWLFASFGLYRFTVAIMAYYRETKAIILCSCLDVLFVLIRQSPAVIRHEGEVRLWYDYAFLTAAEPIVFLGFIFGLYFLAYSKTDPKQKLARLPVAFVPMVLFWVKDRLQLVVSYCLDGVFFSVENERIVMFPVIYGAFGIVVTIIAVVVSFLLVRSFQKKADALLMKQ